MVEHYTYIQEVYDFDPEQGTESLTYAVYVATEDTWNMIGESTTCFTRDDAHVVAEEMSRKFKTVDTIYLSL